MSAFHAKGSIVTNSSAWRKLFFFCLFHEVDSIPMCFNRMPHNKARFLFGALSCSLVLDHGTARPDDWRVPSDQQSVSVGQPVIAVHGFLLSEMRCRALFSRVKKKGFILVMPGTFFPFERCRQHLPLSLPQSPSRSTPQQIDDCAAPAE